jgi:hypothetical protein
LAHAELLGDAAGAAQVQERGEAIEIAKGRTSFFQSPNDPISQLSLAELHNQGHIVQRSRQ